MNRFFICICMLLFASVAFADDKPWNEQTRDAAYEAPSSKFQKKWYDSHDETTTIMFSPNGTFKHIMEIQYDGVGITVIASGSYTRKKDVLTLLYSYIKTTPNTTDLAKLSARKRDIFTSGLKLVENKTISKYKNKKEYYLMLRLDDDCFIYTIYDPQLKVFNDIKWNTWYSESYMKEVSQMKSIKPDDAPIQNDDDDIVSIQRDDEKRIFDIVEQMPSFVGGNEKLMEYITNNLQYPETAKKNDIQGRVIISFVVEEDGSVSNVKVNKSVDPALDAEAVRLVESMPKWEPGRQNGETVRARYSLPISFRL